MPNRPRVALLIESSRAYGRGLLQGVAAWARVHGNWSIYNQERALAEAAPTWLRRWKGDGVIARIENSSLIRTLKRMAIPVVDLRGRHDIKGVPLVETDDRRVVQLAVEHFLERGFERFAYCGFPGANYSERRLRYLREILGTRGVEPHEFASPARRVTHDTTAAETQGLLYEDAIARWLEKLPKPIGLMACNDIRGQQVLNAAREQGIAVPEDVAVIGVDNDEVLCELSDPPMTSVAPDTEKIGYEAAALLDRMMAGDAPPAPKIFVEPRGVVTRQSTDVLAVADREVAAAVRFIREHATQPITVDDVLRQIPLSRSTLERRFNALFGRSPKAEIVRLRLERVKRLLAETDYPLTAIAEMTGFRHAEYLSAVFKDKVGQSPGKYRDEMTKTAARGD